MPKRSDERGGRGVRDRARSPPPEGRVVVQTPKCPVCGWDIKDQGQEVKVQDRTVRVCCDECAREVTQNPSKYTGGK
jgi:hypothetical protein